MSSFSSIIWDDILIGLCRDGPAEAFISVRLLCLTLARVQELDAEVRSGTRSSAPADVAAAMAALPVTWPAPGSLMVTNGKRSFYGDVFVRPYSSTFLRS